MSALPAAAPILVLCGCGPGSENWRRASGWTFPSRGPLTPRASDAVVTQRRFRGLPWSVGDPRTAYLDSPQWAIISVDDEGGPVPAPPGEPADRDVAFDTGTVLYRDDPRGAMETLIQNGADRAAMSVQLMLPDECGIADVGG